MKSAWQVDPMIGLFVVKAPAAEKPYGFDWSDWCADSVTIELSSWEADAGLEIKEAGTQDATTTALLAGGVEGESYRATNRVKFSNGIVEAVTFTVRVSSRRG